MALVADSDVVAGEAEGGPGVAAEVDPSTSRSGPLGGRPLRSWRDAWPARVVVLTGGRPGEA
eukprot:11182272-Lingulodinium_polyedra.AAC.1